MAATAAPKASPAAGVPGFRRTRSRLGLDALTTQTIPASGAALPSPGAPITNVLPLAASAAPIRSGTDDGVRAGRSVRASSKRGASAGGRVVEVVAGGRVVVAGGAGGGGGGRGGVGLGGDGRGGNGRGELG